MRRFIAATLVCLIPQRAPAQSIEDRTLLARLDSAIPPGVLPEVGSAEDGVTRQIQGALGNFARYVREDDRRAAEKALFSLDQASIRRKEWAWPSYTAARVFLAMHERDAPLLNSDGKAEGETYLSAAWRKLEAALERDPKHAEARRLLVTLAYLGGDRELPAPVRRALERDLRTSGTSPLAWIVHARSLRTDQKYPLALGAFDRAALLGADASVIGIERARTLLAVGDTTAAVAAYWAGVDDMTDEGRGLYHQDLEWIVAPDSLRGFDSAPGAAAAAWLHKFWDERDAAAMNPRNGRLTEHLRRWVVAHRDFRVPLPWKRNFYTRFWDIAGGGACIASASKWVDSLPLHSPADHRDPRIREPLLDHRGFIYMRHGEPIGRTDAATQADTTLSDTDASSVNLASWVYWVEGEWRAFHFGGSSVYGGHAPTTLRSYLPLSYDAWTAVAQLLPEYAPAAMILDPERPSASPKTCYTPLQVAVRDQRVDAGIATSTDSDSPLITKPWDAPLRFFALGTVAEGTSRALITFAIPGRNLQPETIEGGDVRYPVSFRIVAFDAASGRTVAIDTVRNFRHARPLGDNQFLTGWFEVPLEAGTWQLSVRAMQDDDEAGAYALRRGLVLDAGGAIALSDVVTGLPGSPERWTAAGQPFPLNTLGAWREGTSVELYYEVRGLTAGSDYTTTLEVIPTDRRQKERISVRIPDVATGTLTPVRRNLGLGRLKAGTYRLVVTVEAGDQKATREQQVLVVK